MSDSRTIRPTPLRFRPRPDAPADLTLALEGRVFVQPDDVAVSCLAGPWFATIERLRLIRLLGAVHCGAY